MTSTKTLPTLAKGIRDYYAPRSKAASTRTESSHLQSSQLSASKTDCAPAEEAVIGNSLITEDAAAQFSQTEYEGLQQETAENGAWGAPTE